MYVSIEERKIPMFSKEERCTYVHSQLAEVICQLRFPEILTIQANDPVAFQDAIRKDFPQFSRRQENAAPRITGAPGNFAVANQPAVNNYQFVSADGKWRVNLTSKFISLSCTKYTCWEDFARVLDSPLASFIRIYQPAYFERIGLRYLNFISRNALGLSGTPYSQLIAPCYLGPLAEEDLAEAAVTRSSVDAEFGIRGGCRAKIHAGPGMVKVQGQADKEVKFVYDLDLFMPGQVQINLSAGALQTLHAQAYPLFRGAITDTLHDALKPVE
jgi:uncharacterized protein (TIGR04255 family)